MDEEQPGWSSNSDTTQDHAKAYEVLANAYYEGQQLAVTLSHAFLQANPILLEEGVLKINWNRIPSLYTRVNQMLTIVVFQQPVEQVGSSRRLDYLEAGLPTYQLRTQHGSGDV